MAVESKDILFDGDVVIENGDFKVIDTQQQQVADIVLAHQGQYKQFPLTGVGIREELNGSTSRQVLKQKIQLQLQADNFRILRISVEENYDIGINATRLRP